MYGINLKSRSGKMVFSSIILYYLADIILSRWYSYPFLVGLVRTRFGLDIVTFGGIFAILHWVLIFAVIPASMFSFKLKFWARKIIYTYIVTAVLFYGLIFYGNLKGGGALELDYIWYFLLNAAVVLFGIFIFMFMFASKRLEPAS